MFNTEAELPFALGFAWLPQGIQWQEQATEEMRRPPDLSADLTTLPQPIVAASFSPGQPLRNYLEP
jgi:hypothetical protein